MSRVLILHDLNYRQRQTTIGYVGAFGRHAPNDVQVEYRNVRRFDADATSPNERFDAIVLTYDLLALRSSPQWPAVSAAIARYRDRCVRCLAFPQDDYTYNVVLDDFLAEVEADVIYSPVEAGLDTVYPKMHRRAEIRHALTGYVDHALASTLRASWAPAVKRSIHVGQRVRLLPPWFGRVGQEKGRLAQRFAERASQLGVPTDISTRDGAVFAGADWYRFLGRCRATIGHKGGASVCDPDGSIMRRCLEFQGQFPDAGFDEVAQACFADLDGGIEMRAISPRLFDAAMTGTVQVLLEDDYLGVLEPWVHYLPTDADVSNVRELADALDNTEWLDRIAAAAFEALVETDRFGYARFVESVFERDLPGSGLPADQAPPSAYDQLQWRLSPQLYEGLLRSVGLAVQDQALDELIALAESVTTLLRRHPSLMNRLDRSMLDLIVGGHIGSPRLEAIRDPLVDILREVVRTGAGQALLDWLTMVRTERPGGWQLLGHSEPVQLLGVAP